MEGEEGEGEGKGELKYQLAEFLLLDGEVNVISIRQFINPCPNKEILQLLRGNSLVQKRGHIRREVKRAVELPLARLE